MLSILGAVTQFGGLYGLPVQTGGLVLYYNKDIFDKFGVSYPKNGMTWDEAIELGKRLTRNENGTQYIGLAMSIGHVLGMNQLSLPYVDKKTEKPAINNDNFKNFAETIILKPVQVSGYKEKVMAINRTFNSGDFMKEKTIGMFIMNFGLQDLNEFQTFNWDMVPIPVFKEKPGIGTQPYPNNLFVTSTSKYKDQAVKILKFLTSDEQQMAQSKKGFAPVLKNEEIRKAFNQETNKKDKNMVNALFFNKFAAPVQKTKYDGIVAGTFTDRTMELIRGDMDLNTALRIAEEESYKKIEAAKKQ